MAGRILFIRSIPFLPIAGSDISMFERLELLQKDYGWEVLAVSFSGSTKDAFLRGVAKATNLTFEFDGKRALYAFRGVRCILTTDPALDGLKSSGIEPVRRELDAAIAGIKPDLLITNFRDPVAITFAQRHPDIPLVAFLTENEYNRPDQLTSDSFGIQYAKALRNLRNVAVAGNFIRESLQQSWQLEARVFVNSIVVERYWQEKSAPGPFIGMFQPFKHKGVELFLRIAAAMPEREFLSTTGFTTDFRQTVSRLRACPNMHLAGFTTNTPAIYRECRLVIMPSFWDEVFPRVMIEALSSGTPVIASTTGGIPEAAGGAAILLSVERIRHGAPIEDCDVEPWVAAIRKLDDPQSYSRQVELARLHVKDYAARLKESMSEMSAWFAQLCAARASETGRS